MRFSRHAKNRMRLHRLDKSEVAEMVVTGKISERDPQGRPIYDGKTSDGRWVKIVTALDAPDYVITVFGEVE